MPRPKGVTDKLRDEKKEKILTTAIELFSNDGYHNTTISKIAQASGVSFGMINYYFENKDNLFKEAVLIPINELRKSYFLIQNVDGSALDRISEMVRYQVREFTYNKQKFALVHYVLGRQNSFPELMQELFAFFDESRDAVIPVILEGQKIGELDEVDPETVFASYFSYLNGIAISVFDPPDHPFWEQLIQQGIHLFHPIHPSNK
ncbi:TetR/AcrR family transcriptional regulator [Chengkuizengella axinellae]|uniref:TetR/AcrR family transcriptional regulator n=1 Tax=Chengkuizengella axinellae TaxID=3064388 RepID=A0ABT9J2W1_9BACL|nr:TetR/AcrR family transcriptional regulator [Chengkuizengella sp. 2205SS18-9]MDP5275355.1 TetR/AcrR family transcriptional regulator [Chengkuizengella sp. 2205SS18-9]